MSRFIPCRPIMGSASSRNRNFNRSWFAAYKHEQVNGFHNYLVTPAAYHWPVPTQPGNCLIDGFSPNMNKYLHAGHLKNLAVASALSKIAGKAVAMLGMSLGCIEGALDQYQTWCQLASYKPTIYFDVDLPKPTVPLTSGSGEYAGCLMHNDVVVQKSDGKWTYAAHDLSFAEHVGPTHYLTGAEQQLHFASLGLGHKHLPLGLVLGSDGKKMKSKTGDAFSAADLLDTVLAALDPTPEPKKLAWNILAWQFNSSNLNTNTKFNIDQWAKSEAPGMYITYTYAKVMTALSKANDPGDSTKITEADVELLGITGQFNYAFNKAQETLEPCHIAQYALVLAKKLSGAYNVQTIVGGEAGFLFALHEATNVLRKCMELLSMYSLTTV